MDNSEVETGVQDGHGRLVTLADIKDAAIRLESLVRRTPTEQAHSLSKTFGREIVLKHEYLQRTGSYKVRGAYNCISRLPGGADVVAASAGNHAQGVALAAALTGRKAVIFMPAGAPFPKIEATQSYGAEVKFTEGAFDESLYAAIAYAEESGAVFVPPFDDHDVIAGQGTVGLELAEDLPASVDTVLIPIGGGGLISGCAVALKALRPDIRIIGVEPENAASMAASLREERRVTLDSAITIADGIAVKRVGEITFTHASALVDDVVAVSEKAIGEAVLMLLERAKAVVEPAGAVGLAAILSGKVPGSGGVCVLLSGGNIDPILLSKVVEYGLTASGRYLRLRVVLEDKAGLLANLSTALLEMNLNVELIEHHRAGAVGLAFNEVEVQLTLETRNPQQHGDVIAELIRRGFPVQLVQ